MIDALIIGDPGPFATIQDLGRHGYQRFGVPVSGAMDGRALRLANRLVGNDEAEAGIEFTLVGGRYEVAAERCRIAVIGDFDLSIDGKPAATCRAHDLERGALVTIGGSPRWVRGYLAVAGGFDVPLVLGSRSTHTRSRLGGIDGQTLRAGQLLNLRAPAPSGSPCMLPSRSLMPDDRPIRVIFGPQQDHFSDRAAGQFLTNTYQVNPRSDRMGYRLDGPPIAPLGDYNIVSDGIAPGSVQIAGNGRPILLLADRQSTGGYPKIATVISADLPRLAQFRPGQEVRFIAVSLDQAAAIADQARNAFNRLCDKIAPLPANRPGDAVPLGVNPISGVAAGAAGDGDYDGE
ncbi:biotin-dependent carboxyltransferase family protein [Telmatospirillum sp.]|uniref:5-oxoprolinase subunit C family protein n=1 Tax=Telmatospirillum sp. TaxID=2079197 RepID=UPI0028443493|nr:biotin-dependent carboxyltransferase family protein [Telmatospirillum sp.]MDR3439832.1 biotin-dependent carboxyltransferase family protein [Telmatospirillum sp.]